MMLRRQCSMVPVTWLTNTRERHATHRLPELQRLGEVSREPGFPMEVSAGQTSVTKPCMLLENVGTTAICRENTSTRDANGGKPTGTPNDNIVMGPALAVQVTSQHGGWCGVDVRWFQTVVPKQVLTSFDKFQRIVCVYHVFR